MDDESVRLAEKLGQVLLRLRLTLACAESCTGGLLTGTLTAVPGGFVVTLTDGTRHLDIDAERAYARAMLHVLETS